MSRKINQYKTTYHKEYGAFIAVVYITIMFFATSWKEWHEDSIYIRSEEPLAIVIAPITNEAPMATDSKSNIEQKIRETFPNHADIMVAVAKAESRLTTTAKGYNCYYNKDETIVYTSKVKGSHSTSCKVTQRQYAWSVDCFVLQRNYIGKECPDITLEQHLQEVQDLSRKQGLQAWASYNSGYYKRFLTQK